MQVLYLLLIEMKKKKKEKNPQLFVNKRFYLDLAILETSKTIIYWSCYCYLEQKYGIKKYVICYIDMNYENYRKLEY